MEEIRNDMNWYCRG